MGIHWLWISPFLYLYQMTLLLKEYLLSGDNKEAERCLRELEVPHFHHEFVYEVTHGIRCLDFLSPVFMLSCMNVLPVGALEMYSLLEGCFAWEYQTDILNFPWLIVRKVIHLVFLLSIGHSHGPGIQRGENVQNGSAAAEVSVGVLHHHCGPNEKGGLECHLVVTLYYCSAYGATWCSNYCGSRTNGIYNTFYLKSTASCLPLMWSIKCSTLIFFIGITLKVTVYIIILFAGIRKSLHGHSWNQHRRPSCVLHLGAVCRQEFQCWLHLWKAEGSLS